LLGIASWTVIDLYGPPKSKKPPTGFLTKKRENYRLSRFCPGHSLKKAPKTSQAKPTKPGLLTAVPY
ncbi:hypothetical protein ACVGXE_15185, partial [Escherichia coli]